MGFGLPSVDLPARDYQSDGDGTNRWLSNNVAAGRGHLGDEGPGRSGCRRAGSWRWPIPSPRQDVAGRTWRRPAWCARWGVRIASTSALVTSETGIRQEHPRHRRKTHSAPRPGPAPLMNDVERPALDDPHNQRRHAPHPPPQPISAEHERRRPSPTYPGNQQRAAARTPASVAPIEHPDGKHVDTGQPQAEHPGAPPDAAPRATRLDRPQPVSKHLHERVSRHRRPRAADEGVNGPPPTASSPRHHPCRSHPRQRTGSRDVHHQRHGGGQAAAL